MSKLKNLKGMRFGRLTVLDRAENNGHHTRWHCICDCGKETITHTTSLTSGRTISCGCWSHEKSKETITTHGYRYTKIYSIWCGMKKRCYNEKYEHYDRYGGRGITVCDEWLTDFISFKNWSDMNGYIEGLEIDRINNNGNYEPSNCRWRTRTQQVRNRTNTVNLEFNNQLKPLKEWCEIYGVKYKLAHARYKKGWSFEKIFGI